MVPETNLTPDRAEIRRDLEFMTARWSELPQPLWLEIRAFAEDKQPQSLKFRTEWLDEAVDAIVDLNARGRNVYVVRNPIRDDCAGSASDKDIAAAFFLWADCDDATAAGNIKRFDGPKYSAAITTGRTPETRVHIYWKLEDACTDLTAWRDMQTRIAAHFKSDSSVINPSRIMRVAGTITWPDTKKRAKGYISEMASLRTSYDEPRQPVTLDQMGRVFGQSTPAASTSSLSIDTGPQPLDRERARIQAMSGQEWHNAVIRLVGSYVSKGLSDDEIHGLTDQLTLDGYTVEQTRREVQTAIDGARRKGWTPEEEQPPVNPDDVAPLMFRFWEQKQLEAIPHPQFVYSDFYARGYTSLTLAAPKVGKSLLGLAEALDMATGRGILTGQRRDPLRVVYYNAEDDQNVIDARVSALLTYYEIQQSELVGQLAPVSGIDNEPLIFISGQEGKINEAAFIGLEKFCNDSGADVLIFDPLQDLSTSPETNEVFRLLGQRLRLLASKCQVSLGLIHHTRKVAPGQAATIEDGRGGSALRGTARFNRILNPMTEDEAAKAGVPNHRHYLRIGDMESNLAPPSADVNRWFEKASVMTPNGHEVGVIKPWKWPDAFDGITPQQAARVRAVIDAMPEPPRENVRASAWVGNVVADVLGINLAEKSGKARVQSIVNGWIKCDFLRVTEEHDPRAGRPTKIVICGANNPLETGDWPQ